MKINSCLSYKRMLLLLLHYFVGYLYAYSILAAFITMKIDPYATEYPAFIRVIVYAFVFIVTVVLAYPLLRKAYNNFIKKPVRILKDTLARFGWLYLSMIICNIILLILFPGGSSSNNQQEVLQSLMSSPILTAIVTIVFAPVVEEIIFRGCLYAKLRETFNYKTCLIISSLAFGFLHIYQSLLIGDFLDCVYILTYSVMGMHFGILYEKHDSLLPCMILHCMNNTLATILMII